MNGWTQSIFPKSQLLFLSSNLDFSKSTFAKCLKMPCDYDLSLWISLFHYPVVKSKFIGFQNVVASLSDSKVGDVFFFAIHSFSRFVGTYAFLHLIITIVNYTLCSYLSCNVFFRALWWSNLVLCFSFSVFLNFFKRSRRNLF